MEYVRRQKVLRSLEFSVRLYVQHMPLGSDGCESDPPRHPAGSARAFPKTSEFLVDIRPSARALLTFST